jgi:tetratricopeptide (TPR) repeat protein
LKLLISIPHPEKLSKADYAAWCLQYTHAQYKLYMNIPSDSLIRISVDYYDKSHLYKQSGTSYYLLGCILQLHKKNKAAMQSYKHAEKILNNTGEDKLKGLIDFKIGYVYTQDELFNQSLDYYKKSLKFFIRSNNINYQAFTYREISDIYYQLNYPFNIVIHYSDLALKLSKESGDSINYNSILSRQGELYFDRNNSRSKDYILQAYKCFPNQKTYYASYLSLLYSKLNRTDSARYYLKISIADSSDSNPSLLKYLAGAYVAKGEGNQNLAFKYLEKAYLNRDSVFQQSIHSQLYRIDKQYDLTQKERENAALVLANRNKVILIGFLLIVVLIALIILLLFNIQDKKKRVVYQMDKQRMEFDIRAKENENEQKRKLLISKLQNQIEIAVSFNQLKSRLSLPIKHETFIEEINKHSIMTEKESKYYLEEVNHLFGGKVLNLTKKYPELTLSDLSVIVFLCLKVDIFDCCSLMNMPLNTMYKRRNTIKKRMGLNAEVDLDKWIEQNMLN